MVVRVCPLLAYVPGARCVPRWVARAGSTPNPREGWWAGLLWRIESAAEYLPRWLRGLTDHDCGPRARLDRRGLRFVATSAQALRSDSTTQLT